MDDVFRALADPTRRSLLDRLFAGNGQTLSQLVEGMGMSRQAVMKHLALLEAANLVSTVRAGREKLHYLNPIPIAEVQDRWIRKYERQRVEALSDLKRGLTSMDKPDFVYVIFIEASPEAIWQGLTDPDFTEKYWGGVRMQSTWEPGAPVYQARGNMAGLLGEVLEADPPRRLSYTFHMSISAAHQADPPSRLTFEIEQIGDMSRLTLHHHHESAGSATQETTSHGWPAIMSSLKSLLESGKPLPFKGLGFGPADKGREGTR